MQAQEYERTKNNHWLTQVQLKNAPERFMCVYKFYSWVLWSVVEMHRMVQCCLVLRCWIAFRGSTGFVCCSHLNIMLWYVNLLTCHFFISVCDREPKEQCTFIKGLELNQERLRQFSLVGLIALSCLELPSLYWHCWLVYRKGIWPPKACATYPHWLIGYIRTHILTNHISWQHTAKNLTLTLALTLYDPGISEHTLLTLQELSNKAFFKPETLPVDRYVTSL